VDGYVALLPPPGGGLTLSVDKAALRAAVDPALQDHYDFLLARAETEPYIRPFELATELVQRTRRLSEYDDRVWVQQCQLLLEEARINADKETMDRLALALDQLRPQLNELSTPARSTVYRDSRN
jgi:hypothetical protein